MIIIPSASRICQQACKPLPLLLALALVLPGLAQSPLPGTPTAPVGSNGTGGGRFVARDAAALYSDMSRFEVKLYGHAYTDESLKKRLDRLEKTLFGTHQRDGQEARFLRVRERMNAREAADAKAEQTPMIEYLEQRLFQQTYPDLAFEARMNQLEAHVFGRTFPEYPLDLRLKKLTYTLPIMAREVRVSHKDGMLVATTRTATARAAADAPMPRPVLATDGGQPVSGGHYFESIYRPASGKSLRWMTLPMRVHVKNGNARQQAWVVEAVALWNNVFPIRIVDRPAQADVLIDWTAGGSGPVTRPVMQLDEHQTIRTVVAIQMGLYRQPGSAEAGFASEAAALRAILHQLGHACGLWGHSPEPGDIMFPASTLEQTDIPERLNRRSGSVSPLAWQRTAVGATPRPSPRDINTLTRLYSTFSAQDFRSFSLQQF